ncbi:MAG: hypothetical protein R2838_21215 [Caldilineaceae bacterium]
MPCWSVQMFSLIDLADDENFLALGQVLTTAFRQLTPRRHPKPGRLFVALPILPGPPLLTATLKLVTGTPLAV